MHTEQVKNDATKKPLPVVKASDQLEEAAENMPPGKVEVASPKKQTLMDMTLSLEEMMGRLDDIHESGEEPSEAMIEALNDMVTNQAEKIDRTCIFINKLKFDIDWLKDEKNKLDAELKKKERTILRLAERARTVMEIERVKELNGLRGHKFSQRKSSYLEVACTMGELPMQYIDTTQSINKKAIKDALKAGGKVNGCEIKQRINIQVK